MFVYLCVVAFVSNNVTPPISQIAFRGPRTRMYYADAAIAACMHACITSKNLMVACIGVWCSSSGNIISPK